MIVYLIEKVVDCCATTTLKVCATKEIAERELNKIIKKSKYNEHLEITKEKLIEK